MPLYYRKERNGTFLDDFCQSRGSIDSRSNLKNVIKIHCVSITEIAHRFTLQSYPFARDEFYVFRSNDYLHLKTRIGVTSLKVVRRSDATVMGDGNEFYQHSELALSPDDIRTKSEIHRAGKSSCGR
jgi:hypothetical protein